MPTGANERNREVADQQVCIALSPPQGPIATHKGLMIFSYCHKYPHLRSGDDIGCLLEKL